MPPSRCASTCPDHAVINLFGELGHERFLAEYWQQKPLLLRAAWPDFENPLSPEELAGLACEDDVCARLVRQSGHQWQVRHGPFDEADFTTLPVDYWTILVPDVEKHIPSLRWILEPFRFIPDWRIDDLMISYATPQGSVGPHVDEYDVFLLQGLGRRRWQINTQPVAADSVQADSALRILQQFEPEFDWMLEPGDLLYLPPGIAHYGVALEPCMTFSIGFRAPEIQELVADFCDYLIRRSAKAGRWRDYALVPVTQPGQIQPQSVQQLETLLRQQLDYSAAELHHSFGRFITESRSELAPLPLSRLLSYTELAEWLDQYPDWQRCAAARFAFIAQLDGAISLFIDGKAYSLSAEIAWLGKLLCQQVSYSSHELLPALISDQSGALLLEWVNQAYLLPTDEYDEH